MNTRKIDIDQLRIASPCPTTWDSMNGDDRSRFCSLCELNVYNLSGMSRPEVEDLLMRREGRLCVRLYRKADGSILTSDCPVGVRSTRKRIAAVCGAALATVLGLFSISYGQKEKNATKIYASEVNMTESVAETGDSSLAGTVTDTNGAVIPVARVELYRGKKLIAKTTADDAGRFLLPSLPTGIYDLAVPATGGFNGLLVKNIYIGKSLKHEVALMLGFESVLVGVVADESLIYMNSNERKTTITREMLERGIRP